MIAINLFGLGGWLVYFCGIITLIIKVFLSLSSHTSLSYIGLEIS